MGIPDGSLLDLIDKVRSWITSDSSDSLCLSSSSKDDFEIMPIVSKMCHDCGTKLDGLVHGYCCLSCGRLWCKSCCYSDSDTEEKQDFIKKLCRECDGEVRELKGKSYDKVHPRDSPDPPSLAAADSARIDNLEIRDCKNIASIRCYPSRYHLLNL